MSDEDFVTVSLRHLDDKTVFPRIAHKTGYDEYVQGIPDMSEDSSSSGMYPRDESRLSRDLHEHVSRKNHTGSCKKRLRTPRSLTRLMQEHRDSERSRHRGLNASIKAITKCIPGYDEDDHDTKIGKLQRIINYICHLEGHIQDLCQQVGLDLEFKNLFLSPHLTENDKKQKSFCRATYRRRRPSFMSRAALGGDGYPMVGLDSTSALSPDNNNTLPGYIFPGNNSYDPFCSEDSRSGAFSKIKDRNSVPVTPPKNVDCFNPGDETIPFLSPDVANFLQTKGYDKVAEDLDLSSPIGKLCGNLMADIDPAETQASHNGILWDSSTRNLFPKSQSHKQPSLAECNPQKVCRSEPVSEYLVSDVGMPLIPDTVMATDQSLSASGHILCGLPLSDTIPRSLDDTIEVSDVEATLDSSDIPHCSHGNSALLSDNFRSVPTLNERSLSFRQTAQKNPDAIHLVPHIEGVDQSDDESESHDQEVQAAANQNYNTTANRIHGMRSANRNSGCETKAGYSLSYGSSDKEGCNTRDDQSHVDCRMISQEQYTIFPSELNPVKEENLDQMDDMFASRLQKIEEDDNDYCLDTKMFSMTPDICEDSLEENKQLFAMSRILKDAGLSPQYLKAGTDHFVTPLCSPINSPPNFCSPLSFQSPPSFQKHFKQFLTKSKHSYQGEPPSCSMSKPPGVGTLCDDSSQSLDISLLSSGSQNSGSHIYRNSTPIDSEYGSLAAELTGAATSKSFSDQSPDVSFDVCGSADRLEVTSDVCDRALTRKRLALYKDINMSEDEDSVDSAFSEMTSTKRRVDHRKISWMNGFMMYSRINRRAFIEKNPGMHTSQISKLMGLEWKRLSNEEQNPYREQASLYAQKVLAHTANLEQ